MNVFPIRTGADHQRALSEIAPFFDNPPPDDDPVWKAVDLMAERIEVYEKQHFPVDAPLTSADVLEFVLNQKGLAPEDLAPALGSPGAVRDVLSGKRTLTPDMLETLSQMTGLPLEDLTLAG